MYLGVALGLYVWLYLMVICGIIDLVDAIMNTGDVKMIVVSVLKILFGDLVGFLVLSLVGLPGYFLVNNSRRVYYFRS